MPSDPGTCARDLIKALTTLAFLAAGLLCLGTPEPALAKPKRDRATAQHLAQELRATGRYRVILTRTDDRYVKLNQRLAKSYGAAMFISLHADASRDRTARGASVYARSGATARTAMFHGTARLQQTMIDNLDDDLRMTGAPAREARLHVLANPTAPSVPVEIGSISNRQDEAQLLQPRHRATIAAAIRDAVDEHFAQERLATRG